MPVTPFSRSFIFVVCSDPFLHTSFPPALLAIRISIALLQLPVMRLSTIGQVAYLFSHTALVHSLGPSACSAPPGGATPALIKQVIVALAPLMYGRVDPIVAPGKASAHVHLGMGGSNWGPSMEEDTALNSACTSTQAKADKSVYWTPRLSFKSPQNGSYISVAATQEKVYYR